MYYELRMYTPHKGKLEEYAELFHTYPEKVFEKLGASLVGMWAVDESEGQPAFVFMIAYRSKEHRAEVFSKLGEQAEMQEYRPKRGPLIDSNIPSVNWLLNPVTYSKMK